MRLNAEKPVEVTFVDKKTNKTLASKLYPGNEKSAKRFFTIRRSNLKDIALHLTGDGKISVGHISYMYRNLLVKNTISGRYIFENLPLSKNNLITLKKQKVAVLYLDEQPYRFGINFIGLFSLLLLFLCLLLRFYFPLLIYIFNIQCIQRDVVCFYIQILLTFMAVIATVYLDYWNYKKTLADEVYFGTCNGYKQRLY